VVDHRIFPQPKIGCFFLDKSGKAACERGKSALERRLSSEGGLVDNAVTVLAQLRISQR
jgi:hypothetical protein